MVRFEFECCFGSRSSRIQRKDGRIKLGGDLRYVNTGIAHGKEQNFLKEVNEHQMCGRLGTYQYFVDCERHVIFGH